MHMLPTSIHTVIVSHACTHNCPHIRMHMHTDCVCICHRVRERDGRGLVSSRTETSKHMCATTIIVTVRQAFAVLHYRTWHAHASYGCVCYSALNTAESMHCTTTYPSYIYMHRILPLSSFHGVSGTLCTAASPACSGTTKSDYNEL